jgi:hypothetical protein
MAAAISKRVTSEYAAPVLTRKYLQLKMLRPRRHMANVHMMKDAALNWSRDMPLRCHASTAARTRNTDVNNPKPV